MTIPENRVPVDDDIDWDSLMAAGLMLGWTPHAVFRATIPELMIAIAADRRTRGLPPSTPAMTRERLMELHERYSK